MEPKLKDMYNKEFLNEFTEKVNKVYSNFNSERFLKDVMNELWENLSLKARMRRIAETLGQYLPRGYEDALKMLYLIDESYIGFPYLFFPDFVEVYGQDKENWELSMAAMERFTQRSSSEFAIRPFIIKDPEYVMNHMMIWRSILMNMYDVLLVKVVARDYLGEWRCKYLRKTHQRCLIY